jgi:hypothetical protein
MYIYFKVYTYICINNYTQERTHIYIYIHTHTHIQIQTYTNIPSTDMWCLIDIPVDP